MGRLPGLKFVAPSVLCCILICYGIWKSLVVIPIPDGDQLYFYPIYLSVANVGKLENPFRSPLQPQNIPSSPDQTRLTWHGWLQPYLFGFLMKGLASDIRSALLVESAAIAIGLGLFLISGGRRLSTTTASIPIVFTSLVASEGRPELLACLLILAGLAIDRFCSSARVRTCTAGVVLGLIAVTQPTIAILGSIILLAILLYRYDDRLAITSWILSNALAALLMGILLAALYPYPISEWISGLLQMGRLGAERRDTGEVLRYFIANPLRPGHGVVLLLAVGAFCWDLRLKGRLRPTLAFAMGLSLVSIWYFACRAAAANYNAMCFVPAALVVVSYAVKLRWANALILTISALSIVPIILTVYSEYYGAPRDEVRARIAALIEQGFTVQLDLPLLVGGVPFEEWKNLAVNPGDAQCVRAGERLLLKQANTGLFDPAKPSGCKLIEDGFAKAPFSTLWSMPVPKAYNFAEYARQTE
jgi:hypothetical protein